MYTYLELDNLEYAIRKYALGYMSTDVAYRSLKTFISRCASGEFRQLAYSLAHDNLGYDKETRAVVDKVCERMNATDALDQATRMAL